MPKMDGIRRRWKLGQENMIPLIMLSAKSEDHDKILGLNIGADDYMGKPFNPLELIARVKSQLRRYTACGGLESVSNLFQSGDWRLMMNGKGHCRWRGGSFDTGYRKL